MTRLMVNGKEAVIGETYLTFRGEEVTLLGYVRPEHPGSTGRIYILRSGQRLEVFPGVIGGKWEEIT